MSKKKHDGDNIAEHIIEDLNKFENFAIGYWQPIVYVAVLIVIVVAVTASILKFGEFNDQRAIDEIVNAESVEQLVGVIDKYQSTHPMVVGGARMRLADIYQTERAYDKAKAQYEAIAARKPAGELAWRTSLNLAYIAELQGDDDTAAAAFETIAANASYPEDIRNQGVYNAARILASDGDKAKAIALLKGAKPAAATNGRTPFWSEQAKSLLNLLECAPGPAAPKG